MEKFGFVILHYGNIDVTDRCIRSILNLDREGYDIRVLIVDNDTNKTESERDRLSERYAGSQMLEIIRIQEPSGFSHANNIGYKGLKESFSPDFMIVANNDITFEDKAFIKKCLESYNKYRWDILSPDVLSSVSGEHQSPIAFRGRTLQELNRTILLNETSLLLFPLVSAVVGRKLSTYGNNGFIDRKKEGIVPCGACIILSNRFINSEEKLFEPETKFYYEEYILHERCRREGYSIMYYPDIQVIHADGVSTRNRTNNDNKRLRFLLKNTAESARVYRKYMYGK